MTHTTSFKASRGVLAALRGFGLLALCLGLAAAFVAEVQSGPRAPLGPSDPGATLAHTQSPKDASPAHS